MRALQHSVQRQPAIMGSLGRKTSAIAMTLPNYGAFDPVFRCYNRYRMNANTGKVIVYTDGAAEPNPGPGGYGVVLMSGSHRKELSGGFAKTTNNRMELMAVIVGLESLTRPCRVVVFSDSKYVVDSVTRGSVHRWQKKNWFRNSKERAKNVDLWKRFLEVYKTHEVEFRWVKGHAGVVENERCDELAVAAAQQYDSPPDAGYLEEIGQYSEKLFSADDASEAESPSAPTSSRAAAAASASNSSQDQDQAEIESRLQQEGDPCKKCGAALIKKATKKATHKPGQTYCYDWYLRCPSCNIMYMVDAAKRMLK